MARYLLFICAVLITAALFTSCASKPAGSGETSEQIPQISETASPVFETAELPESTAENDVTTAAEENIPGSTKVLYIYTFKSSPNYYWASAEPPDTEQNPHFVPTGTYPCKTDGAECVSNAGSKLLISDGGWYICDALSGACEELKLNFAKDDYSISGSPMTAKQENSAVFA